MCLVAVHIQQPDGSLEEKPRFEDVARIKCNDGELTISELFGASETIAGRIQRIDLVQNVIVIETSEAGPGQATDADRDEENGQR